MILHSIRWRLQAWHGLILVAVLTGFGLTAYHVARENQLRRIDQDLDRQLMTLFRPPPGEERPDRFPGRPPEPPPDRPPGGRPPGDFGGNPAESARKLREAIQRNDTSEAGQTNACYYVFWGENGSVLAQSAGTPGAVPPPAPHEPPSSLPGNDARDLRPSPDGPISPPMIVATRTRGDLRELLRYLPRGETILVGRSIASDLAAMRRLALWLAAAGGGILLFGLAGGWWLANRAIRPIEDISATAVRIAAGDLSQRIDAADTDSEFGRLAGVLNSTFARLEAAFAHQARFTSNASHELRTPVTVILSQTQTALARERNGPEYREALEACQRAAQRMRRLIESLLELARLDAGEEPMKRDPFDLARVARECVELVRPLAAERSIELQCDLPAVEACGDAERLGQVATNLLTNAIQFNRDRGEVRIATRVENGHAILAVTDTGEGIPEADRPHIFERFYRADKSRSRRQGHTGLGLAICKAIMDAHGGAIEVASQPGAGSTFTVKLPVA